MREICADSDFDFVAAEPRRKSEGKRGKRGKGRKASLSEAFARIRAAGRYATPVIAVVALTGLLGAVAINAMFLQHGHHPAPLLGSTPFKSARPATMEQLLAEQAPSVPPAPATEVAAPSAVAAVPAPPAYVTPTHVTPTHAPPAHTAPAHPAPVVAAPAPAAKKSHDVIGALIGGGAAAPAPARVRDLRPAQRALQLLGAPVTPNGAYGASTRKAVEAFQRQNNLPVSGELTARTKRLLSARTGVAID